MKHRRKHHSREYKEHWPADPPCRFLRARSLCGKTIPFYAFATTRKKVTCQTCLKSLRKKKGHRNG